MASITISIDAELTGGATVDTERRQDVEDAWRRIIHLFSQNSIPATWAVVGRLCNPSNPQSAPGLVKQLINSDTAHELASHSYDHPRYSSLTPQSARSDLEASYDVLAKVHEPPTSFVYPYNNIGHRSLLAKCGFRCYRGPPPSDVTDPDANPRRPIVGTAINAVPDTIKANTVRYWDRISELIAYSRGIEPPLVTPQVDKHGLVAFPASLPSLFRTPASVLERMRSVGVWPIRRVVTEGIEGAIREDGHVHYWFHPHDLSTERDFECLSSILSTIKKHQKAGALSVETMQTTTDKTRASESDHG